MLTSADTRPIPSRRVAFIAGILACLELAVLATGCGRSVGADPDYGPPSTDRIARETSRPREFHVDPVGTRDNKGTRERPLDLATALSKDSPARPGDTIWLHQGVYTGTFVSHLAGAPGAPIIVRQYPGERATIDSNPSPREALLALGSWTWFWGFEIMNSNSKRRTEQRGSWPDDLPRGPGVTARGTYLKFINMVVHDMSEGFDIWEEAIGTEAHGNLVFFNGWVAPDRGHGHGIYTQNSQASTRVIRDNIIFNQFSHGIHAYGSQRAPIDNIQLEGNISFNNGAPAGDFARDILLGGGRPALNPVVKENFTYGGAETNVGYAAGCENGAVTGNYFAQRVFVVEKCQALVTGNVFLGAHNNGTLRDRFHSNTYLGERVSGTVVRVRLNGYEPGRANIVVYNWDRLPVVTLDIRAACRGGADFEIRDVQNFFGPTVATGRCPNGGIKLRLTDLSVASTIGAFPAAPSHTAPEFAVFVVLPRGPRGN